MKISTSSVIRFVKTKIFLKVQLVEADHHRRSQCGDVEQTCIHQVAVPQCGGLAHHASVVFGGVTQAASQCTKNIIKWDRRVVNGGCGK